MPLSIAPILLTGAVVRFPRKSQPPPSANLLGGEVVWVVKRPAIGRRGEDEADFKVTANAPTWGFVGKEWRYVMGADL